MNTKTVIILCLLSFFAFGSVYSQQQLLNATTPMSKGREMYGAAVLGDYLYIIGGNRIGQGYTVSVEKALISHDGNISAWAETSPLPANRSYIENATIPFNDIVYIVGGLDGNRNIKCNTIVWGRPSIDGSIEKWFESIPFPGSGVDCTVAFATPGFIHLAGGAITGDVPTAEVWTAQISSDGSITKWERAPSLPFKLWYHCGGVAGGYVWIWGGLTGHRSQSVNRSILFTPILSSGKLGEWQLSQSTLPRGFYSASSTISGQFLISFCPRYAGAEISSDIWYAYVHPHGISEWTCLPTTIQSKLYIGLATDYRRGHVYIPGGRRSKTRGDIDNMVYYFTLTGSDQKVSEVAIADSLPTGATGSSRDHLSYLHQNKASGDCFKGFLPYDQARTTCLTQNKPLILYFHTAQIKKCEEQQTILSQFDTLRFNEKTLFSEVDALRFPQIAQQHGIFKIPCWVFFDKRGGKIKQHLGVLKLAEIEAYATYIDQQ